MSSDLTIAISGKSGCGNSTVSRLVSEALGLRMINYTFRSIAEEDDIPFAEVCRRAEHDDAYDRRVDIRQVELASQGNCVLGSRLAIWLVENADLRVYLKASLDVRAARIAEREGGEIEWVKEATRRRDERDRARYLRLYDIDVDDPAPADLVVDAGASDQFEITSEIVAWFGGRNP